MSDQDISLWKFFLYLFLILGGMAAVMFVVFEDKPDQSTEHVRERFASIKTIRANVRTGANKEYYPIKWSFVFRGLPVRILEQYDQGEWYYIRDWEGEEGWIYKTQLNFGQRRVIVIGGVQTIYRESSLNTPIARIEERVVGDLRRCNREGRCLVVFGRYEGWIESEGVWGVDEEDFGRD